VVLTILQAQLAIQYRRLEQDGEPTLTTTSSPIIGQAMASAAAKMEPLALPHACSHLAPLAAVA
jgi:hypothetical protein